MLVENIIAVDEFTVPRNWKEVTRDGDVSNAAMIGILQSGSRTNWPLTVHWKTESVYRGKIIAVLIRKQRLDMADWALYRAWKGRSPDRRDRPKNILNWWLLDLECNALSSDSEDADPLN